MKALLVSDVQESFRQRETWALNSNPDVVAQVGRMVDHARGAGDAVFTKTAHNAGLQQYLVERGITELAVCGIRTEQRAETTTGVASDLGYRVDFGVDATATMPIERWDAPAGRFAAIRTVDELTEQTDRI